MKKVVASLAIGLLIGSATIAAAAPNTVSATVAKFKILINGEARSASTNQLIYKGTTYVPIRDAASNFGYEVKFDNSSKTIEFTSTSVESEITGDWISLYDFEILNDVEIHKLGAVDGAYRVARGQEDLFTFNASSLKDGEEAATTSKSGNVITFRKYLGAILLNKAELKEAGFNI